jgi:hypothetical protein
MQFFYGSYTHPAAEVAFEGINRSIIYSHTQRANILRETWNLKGRIVKQGSTSQADVWTALAAIRAAYSVNGYSAGFAGTPFLLDNSLAIGGVIVLNPVSHGPIMGAEGVTYLNFAVSLQMDSFKSNINDLLNYSETVTFSDIGGGPLQVGRIPISGVPIIQSRSTNSFFYATQNGFASSRNSNIQAEDMLWPASLMGEDGAKNISPVSAKMERGVPVEYGISWSYKFRQVVPFTGSPHHRG